MASENTVNNYRRKLLESATANRSRISAKEGSLGCGLMICLGLFTAVDYRVAGPNKNVVFTVYCYVVAYSPRDVATVH